MAIEYYEAPDVKQLVKMIITELNFTHVNPVYIHCFRSTGSKSKRTIARIHSLEKLWQKALKAHPRYLIEVISERYYKLSQAEREKVIIHELLHIPRGFSGGFRPHKGYITKKKLEKLYKTLHRRRYKYSENLKSPKPTSINGCRP